MQWLVGQGATLLVPILSSPDYDVVARLGHRLERVQVRTCTCRWKGRWSASSHSSSGCRRECR
jgi:hypothetical protein